MPFAYAEDYVTKFQINAANGVAGLDSSKQATVDISNSRITTSQMKILGQ
ncbi:hypothetical protein [Commensalibacter oyaizuii]|uniref:Flagellin n=1 Tax=Commensalibacter oyaizuii TaxID=3043873 RepID=A0ABT6Q4H5_9PROT|nr:hypothetical protein [Commensalibacter sp. TBRC 16381]MDI2091466.1 hypothetical protein [Commensalibacter sp. TBRC 16381]